MFIGSSSDGKSGICIVHCKSWEEFKGRIVGDLFSDSEYEKGKYLFRGQGLSGWNLLSTFDRWYKGSPGTKNKVADALLVLFEQECESEDLPQELLRDPVGMLGLAQHHGLPTRLLDWSESPYVASFFAFSAHVRTHSMLDLENHVAIWVLDTSDYIWDKEHGCAIVRISSHGNQRIRNQFGRFTHLRAPYDSLEEYVGNFREKNGFLKKYLIPVREFRKAITDLDAMGITSSRIYPGLEGNARAAEVRMTLRQMKESKLAVEQPSKRG